MGRFWILLGLLAMACDGLSLAPAGAGARYLLAAIGPASGTNAEKGDTVFQGARLAIAEINRAGGIQGKEVQLLTGDDQSNPQVGVKVAAKFIEQGVLALIGCVQSSISQAVLLEAAKPHGVTLISPASTSPRFSDPSQIDTGGYFFRTIPSDSLQGKVLAQKALALGYRKLAVIHVDNAYGQGLAEVFQATLAQQGATATLFPYPEKSQPMASYADLVDRALAHSPDATCLIAYPGDASQIVDDWIASGRLPTMRWLLSEALKAQSFLDNVTTPARLEGSMGTSPFQGGDRYDAFRQAFVGHFGHEPSLYAANAYDATMLAALARHQGTAIHPYLPAVSSPPGQEVGPGQYAEASRLLTQGQDVDWDGASGPVDLTATGDVTSGRYAIWTIRQGQLVTTDEVLSP